jgi:hypothetical protein
VLLVAAIKSCATALLVAVRACTTRQHTSKLIVSFSVVNLPRVLLCRHNYLFFIAKAALAAVVPKSAWRRVAVEPIVVSRIVIKAIVAL